MEYASMRKGLVLRSGSNLLFKRPFTALKYVPAFLRRKKRIASLTVCPLNQVERFYQEIQSNRTLRSSLEEGLNASYYGQNQFAASELYVICRLLRPSVVVETGVAAGYSSTFILQALQDAGYGHLYSIDIGKGEFDGVALPPKQKIGWLVPASLRSRWTLNIGSSSEMLKPLLQRLGEINLFYHDSDHSYQNMTFEFETAWKHLSTPGIILSDDIDWNKSFSDFCERKKMKAVRVMLGLGAARKDAASGNDS
jgi:Methyltransferase domain